MRPHWSSDRSSSRPTGTEVQEQAIQLKMVNDRLDTMEAEISSQWVSVDRFERLDLQLGSDSIPVIGMFFRKPVRSDLVATARRYFVVMGLYAWHLYLLTGDNGWADLCLEAFKRAKTIDENDPYATCAECWTTDTRVLWRRCLVVSSSRINR